METKANYVLIGAFTLLMIATGFGLMLFFSGASGITVRRTYEIVFDGPVGGLGRGSSVTFGGLRVGEVTWVDLDPNDPRRIVAYFQIFRSLVLHKDTKAQLESQGLTGNVVIALSGGSPDSPVIRGDVGEEPIRGQSSEFQGLLAQLASISTKADSILTKADKLLDDNGAPITDTIKNIDAFSKALGANASGVQDALASVADLAKRAGPLADRLSKLSDDADQIVKSLDTGKLNHIVDNVDSFTNALAGSQGDIKALLADASGLVKRLNDATVDLPDTVSHVEAVIKAVEPQKVASFMNGADAIGSVLQENRGNLDRLIKNASELSAKLDTSADKVDALLDTANSFLGSADVKGPLAQVGDAAKSIHQLADDLDVRVKEMSGGLNRFANSGLREYEALAVDARKTIGDVDRLIRSIEDNPTQIIFGKKKTQ
jgi:phospholipid/cholesterol/gamma-HCH transport system substrate-binding protein